MQRLSAAVIALTACVALGLQFYASQGAMAAASGEGSVAAVVWRMAGYFTILTNSLVALSFALFAVLGAFVGPRWWAGLTLWICAVGAVYHAVLAQLWQPEGLAWWADQGLHTAVPALVLLWWLLCADKRGLRAGDALWWLVYPALYCLYALARGGVSGFYPYPFLDLGTLSGGDAALNIAGLCFGFWLGGLALVALARMLSARTG